jgi:imidazolonepropionase-like amidohydrolase
MRIILSLCILVVSLTTYAQISAPHNGAPPSSSGKYGIKNATILLENGQILEHGQILIEGDRIARIGSKFNFPEGIPVFDYSGKTIVAAFVELSSNDGIAESHNHQSGRPMWPQFWSNKLGPFYWNESIAAEYDAVHHFKYGEGQNLLESMGFGFVVPHNADGVARGTAPLIAIGADARDGQAVRHAVAAFFSLEKAHSAQTYPSSQMGAIALIRQAIIDALWYEANKDLPLNYTLAALAKQLKGKLIFEVQNHLEVLRVAKIYDEFNLKGIIRGGGDEYQRIDQIAGMKHDLILPLRFPEPLDVSNAFIAKEIPLHVLKHWELAASNPYAFHRAKKQFSFTSKGLKSADEFWKAIRKTIQRGLPWEEAYAALTIRPAQLIDAQDIIGSLKENALASFNVYSGNPFLDSKAELLESWQVGNKKVHKEQQTVDLRGNYNVNLNGSMYTLFVKGKLNRLDAEIIKGSEITEKAAKDQTTACNLSFDGVNVSLSFKINGDNPGLVLLNGQFYPKFGTIEGQGLLPNGERVKWTAIRHKPFEEKREEKPKPEIDTTALSHLWYPNLAYGLDSVPTHNTYLIRNATIWTGEAEGVIENGDILIQNGKIKHVGKGSFNVPKGALVIEAKGKYVTAGIIDEHSHIAISNGVNESGLSITAEVSIGTVINPRDINIYRQMAGGVTCSQLLHGSANAIGGQSALIKLKWGYDADGLLLDNAPKFIKFALGENVKQSNWGDYNTTRFPQTRMGVEQVYFDAFYRAKYYYEERSDNKKKKAFRRDLRLEALAEILNGERHITCHSYVQSEINMLMKVGDSMGFKVNTFTHILEGYKLIPQMVKHGAGGSTFSDWWAYKYEVIDAIPQNTCMMSLGGVVTAINSDDAEMGRRLNQEAAKAVKYGGLSEQDAWKTVTLNPAKLLKIDNRMGSLKEGKDADIVIWSENPLSVNAKCEQTFIDGILFFDIRRHDMLQKRNEKERMRIIALMIDAAKNGENPVSYILKRQPLYHCDTEEHHTHHHGH